LPVFLVELVGVHLGRPTEIEIGPQDAIAFHFAKVLVARLEAWHIKSLDVLQPGFGALEMREDGLVIAVGHMVGLAIGHAQGEREISLQRSFDLASIPNDKSLLLWPGLRQGFLASVANIEFLCLHNPTAGYLSRMGWQLRSGCWPLFISA
jgi:hypothetical protein